MNRLLYFVLFLYSFGISARAEQVYLISEGDKEYLLTEKSPFNISGDVDNFAFGVCFQNDCEKSFNMSDAFKKNMALSNGFLNIPKDQEQLYDFPEYLISSRSRIEKNEDGSMSINISINAEIDGNMMSMGSKQVQAMAFPLEIDFSNTEESSSKRVSFSEVNTKYSSYYRNVFQMMGAKIDNGLGGVSQSHGTGFFIDKRGYALTNLHVLNENPQCVKRRSCIIEIKQKNTQSKSYNVALRVLTCSERNDFCLIKINPPEDFIFDSFEIDLDSISRNLMTLGFPGDKERDFKTTNDEDISEIDLTFSFGSPVGFSGTAITSSLFIFGGASGSPIIDLETGKVVGINSNGAESFAMGQDGFPGIFRSLSLINEKFNILDYLSGEKQRKIEVLIKQLKEVSSKNEAEIVLEKIDKHKSFYGRSKLEVLSYNHKNPKVRKAINKYLRRSALLNC
ncbi:serine protease [Halobacteriovorax sp. GB3]|uniref:S1 family peptidase n=1 Tax=Halobacteriovorax sp. GB3 TaxID=2719615 RepID=UPI0023602236|nr:serine protease [Halobacteriovorax sp. GB3]MDD0854180.1 serine protease [Halobacteriovorax sp. GB3]